MTIVQLHPAAAAERRVYIWIATVTALIAFVAVMPTYWLQLPAGTFRGSVLLHVHVLLFSAWPLLFLAQTWLAARGRLERHRAWGVAGVSLATAMVIIGLASAHERLLYALGQGYGDAARAFLIVQVSGIALFGAALAAAALTAPRHPEWHKRLMIVATASLLQAPLARIPFLLVTGGGPGVRPGLVAPPPVWLTTPTSMAPNLLLLAGLIYDIRTRGRPHPAYPVGLAVTALAVLLRPPLSHTHAWLAFADAFARIAG